MSKRTSLLLDGAAEKAVGPFLKKGTIENASLNAWAKLHGAAKVESEASALRTLLQAGAEALQEQALEAGYAELAAAYSGDQERAERRAARDRYAGRTDSAL